MSSHSPQHADEGAAPAVDEASDDTKPPFCSKIQRFFHDPVRSKVVVPAFLVALLLSFSIGLTVGIVPEVLSDRYARLYHGYGNDSHDSEEAPPCWAFQKSSMPDACSRGADDAQTGSAWGMFLQNMFTFFFNAAIGSYSDVHGRRYLLILSVFLNTLVPGALLMLQLFEAMDPFWFYVANAATGLISINAIVFATLSDNCPEEYRAGRFATNLAGFYTGFATAPALALWMTHLSASWWSFLLLVAALVFSILFLPETLPTADHGPEDELQGLATETPVVIDDIPGLSQCDTDVSQQSYLESFGSLLLQPLREMTILNRNGVMRLLALGSFLAAAVYSTDSSLVLFYIEEHLNVREDDIAYMFFLMGLLGAILQGIGLQPLVYILGENGLLRLTFVSGTVHNLLYGVARNKSCITAALSLSQLTKLSYPLLSSLASRQVGLDEQGQVQGALLALNALAGALGPVSMNWIYQRTESSDKYFGPGTMFLLAASLYFMGAGVVGWIPSEGDNGPPTAEEESSQPTDDPPRTPTNWENGDLEEPLLLRLGESTSI